MSGNDPHGLPGTNAIGDTMEFVKSLWASMKLPGMSMPSLSPEDIDKQIADLKAVESWLQMNMNLLRSTIQALEVQSATLNALRSMGQSFTNAANTTAAPPPPSFDKRPGFDSPFEPVFDKSARTDDAPADTPTSGFQDAAAAQFANSAAWWNTVQEQFSNAVEQALTPVQKPAKKRAATKTTSAAKTTAPRKRTPKA